MKIQVYGEWLLLIHFFTYIAVFYMVKKFMKEVENLKPRMVYFLVMSLVMSVISALSFQIAAGGYIRLFLYPFGFICFDGFQTPRIFFKKNILCLLALSVLSGITLLLMNISHQIQWVYITSIGMFLAMGEGILVLYRYFLVTPRSIQFIDIWVDGKSAKVYALVDSGHSLKDPISLDPVIVCDVASIEKILPKDFLALFAAGKTEDLEAVLESIEASHWQHRFRFIPYETIGEKNMLLGFSPDRVLIDGKTIKAIIGISPMTLSKHHRYNALISEDILQEPLIKCI